MPNFKYNLILAMEDSSRCIEIREYLRDLGYKISHDASDGIESYDWETYELIYTTNGVATCDFLSAEEICEYVEEGYILCHNIDEFKVIAAINVENDLHQWFCIKQPYEYWVLCTENKWSYYRAKNEIIEHCLFGYHKATPAELIYHFNNK